jgi:hypothetical protein
MTTPEEVRLDQELHDAALWLVNDFLVEAQSKLATQFNISREQADKAVIAMCQMLVCDN